MTMNGDPTSSLRFMPVGDGIATTPAKRPTVHRATGTTLLQGEEDGRELTLRDLADWEQYSWTLTADEAIQLGFTLGSVSQSAKSQVFVREFSRTTQVERPPGPPERWGIAVRLVIEATGFDGHAKLTLPALAAEVQLSAKQAECRLKVLGYRGNDVAAHFPDFTTFDVESYAQVMANMTQLRDLLGAAQDQDIQAELLQKAQTTTTGASSARRTQLGLVLGLYSLAEGLTLAQALQSVRHSDPPELATGLRQAYQEIVGTGIGVEFAAPTVAQRAAARDDLAGSWLVDPYPAGRG